MLMMHNKKLFLVTFSLLLFTRISLSNSLFPEIPGWKMTEEKRVYNSGDLWELINGAADIFLSYYFTDLHIAEYTNNEQIVRVELYRHDSPENAYGIFTAERMPDYPQVHIGTLGYKSQGVLNFLAGNYYVKIMSAGSTEANENTIALIAAKVDTQLQQPVGLPDVIKLFPEDGKVWLTDAYIAQNFLGYSFLHSAYTAHYNDNSEFQLFIIRSSSEDIQKMLNQYINLVKDENVEKDKGLYIIKDMFNGTVFLENKYNHLIGVVNTENRVAAEDLINKVINRLTE
jgi:hypothetical protein